MDDIPKFWRAVRRAVQDVYRVGVYTPDTPLLAKDELPAKLVPHADRWFRQETVSGYDEGDLRFLTKADRDRVRDAVERFRSAAPADGNPATQSGGSANLAEAARALADICEVLDFYRYRDWPALKFGKQIEQQFDQRFGRQHVGVLTSFRFFTDSPGERGYLYMFALLSEKGAERAGGFLNCTRVLRDELMAVAAPPVVPEHWYVLPWFRYDTFPSFNDIVLRADGEEDDESAALDGAETGEAA